MTCLLTMIVLSFINIVMRNTTGGGIAWADKLLINLVLWVGILGGAVASKDNNHITIDVVSNFIPVRYHKYLNAITNCFAAFICAVLAYEAYNLVAQIEYPAHQVFILHIQTWIPMAIMPFGLALMSFRFARLMILDIIKIIKKREEI
ncbi:MAG: TRAP transporter small permease [Deltaproteobacteria bacterium]|nr:TRAP transporter small permease [Deltaproteobacteria bacterium]